MLWLLLARDHCSYGNGNALQNMHCCGQTVAVSSASCCLLMSCILQQDVEIPEGISGGPVSARAACVATESDSESTISLGVT